MKVKELNILIKIMPTYGLALLVLMFVVLCGGYALAGQSAYPELSRNATLEVEQLNKPLKQLGLGDINNKKLKKNELSKKQIAKKAKELEGVFLSVMIEPMFPKGKESALYGGGQGNDIFRSLMMQQYGKIMADSGGVGLASGIEKQLMRQQ